MKRFLLLLPILAIAAHAAPVPIFDGKSLDGWEGDAKLWRVEDGMITGGSLTEKVAHNDFLATVKSYANFDLRLKIKLSGTEGFINSGVQIRSLRVPGSPEMSGYQVDYGKGWYGKIYDESRRNKVIARIEGHGGARRRRSRRATGTNTASAPRARASSRGSMACRRSITPSPIRTSRRTATSASRSTAAARRSCR